MVMARPEMSREGEERVRESGVFRQDQIAGWMSKEGGGVKGRRIF